MAEKKYQGWTNRETWAVNLWMENERPINEDVTKAIIDGNLKSFVDLEDYVKDELLDPIIEESQEYPMPDLAYAALARVDWRDLWDSWKQKAEEIKAHTKKKAKKN